MVDGQPQHDKTEYSTFQLPTCFLFPGVCNLPPEPVRPMQEAVQRADQKFGKPTGHRSGKVKQRYHTSSVTEYRMIPLFFNLVHLREVRLEGIILPHITYTQSQIQYTRSASAKAMAARWITNA